MAKLPKVIYKFTIILITIPAAFAGTGKLILKFIWNYKGLPTAKTILKKSNKVGELRLSNFKTC